MGTKAPIRVVLVEDHELFRSGLRALLEEESGVEVVAETGDGGEAVAIVAEAAPDVVVMDINLPGISGIDATRRIRAESPSSRVVILSVYEDDEHITEAILAGACGYLLKDSAVEDISEGVRAAVRGEASVSARIAATLLDRVRADEPAEIPPDGNPQASDRELEVLGLIAAGRDIETVAADLSLDPHLVSRHLSNLLAKIEIRERTGAAAAAARRGAA